MEIVIKNGMKKREIERKMKELENSSNKKKFNPYKYLGKIEWKQTPLKIQKQMRDEF